MISADPSGARRAGAMRSAMCSCSVGPKARHEARCVPSRPNSTNRPTRPNPPIIIKFAGPTAQRRVRSRRQGIVNLVSLTSGRSQGAPGIGNTPLPRPFPDPSSTLCRCPRPPSGEPEESWGGAGQSGESRWDPRETLEGPKRSLGNPRRPPRARLGDHFAHFEKHSISL